MLIEEQGCVLVPQYRFNRSDAKAVVAYLRSLKPSPQPLAHAKGKQ